MQVWRTLFLGALMNASTISAVAAEGTVGRAPAMQAATGPSDRVDPEPGQSMSQLVSAGEEPRTEATDPVLFQENESLQIIYFEDGSSMMDLRGRFQQATVAEVQPDASVRTQCQDDDHLRLGAHAHDSVAIPTGAKSTPEVQ